LITQLLGDPFGWEMAQYTADRSKSCEVHTPRKLSDNGSGGYNPLRRTEKGLPGVNFVESTYTLRYVTTSALVTSVPRQ